MKTWFQRDAWPCFLFYQIRPSLTQNAFFLPQRGNLFHVAKTKQGSTLKTITSQYVLVSPDGYRKQKGDTVSWRRKWRDWGVRCRTGEQTRQQARDQQPQCLLITIIIIYDFMTLHFILTIYTLRQHWLHCLHSFCIPAVRIHITITQILHG